VLHATIDIKTSLINIKKLLKDGGCVIIAEVSPPENSIYRFMELTFGLIPSYNNYRDKDIRPLSPLISQKKWIEVLENENFKNVYSIPGLQINNYHNYRGGVIIGFK
jgi:ubiquinone/menaquinone biosynthesis C-methylase UbiE